jgi:hypothetical protein
MDESDNKHTSECLPKDTNANDMRIQFRDDNNTDNESQFTRQCKIRRSFHEHTDTQHLFDMNMSPGSSAGLCYILVVEL